MPLFVCDQDDAIENTALGNFWARELNLFSDESLNGKALCSGCAPGTYKDGSVNDKGGKWHGRFDRRSATPELIEEIGRHHFLYLGRFGKGAAADWDEWSKGGAH